MPDSFKGRCGIGPANFDRVVRTKSTIHHHIRQMSLFNPPYRFVESNKVNKTSDKSMHKRHHAPNSNTIRTNGRKIATVIGDCTGSKVLLIASRFSTILVEPRLVRFVKQMSPPTSTMNVNSYLKHDLR